MTTSTIKNKFFEYFEGYFNNQLQAFNFPREFAMIELSHTKIGKDKFRVTQKYIIDSEPYRQAIIKVTLRDDKTLLLENFKDDENQTPLAGCDVFFEYIDGEFHGKNTCKECYIQRGIKNTYLMTEGVLGDGYYKVIDKGYDVETDEQIWGSYNGHFEFDRK